MLNKCKFADVKFKIPEEEVKGAFDVILLRQVLHYLDESLWQDLLMRLSDCLKKSGLLLFSQIVPRGKVDQNFFESIATAKRPERKSFPTEDNFIKLVHRLELKVVSYDEFYMRRSLATWVSHDSDEVASEVERLLVGADDVAKAVWKIDADGKEVTWLAKWVSIGVEP